MSTKKEIIKFQENESVRVRINFDYPIESNGRYGKRFCYGVSDDVGHEKVMFATEKLHNLLQAIGDIKGRWLEIEKKVTDNNKNYWIIRDNGEEITPNDEDVRNYMSSLGRKDEMQEKIQDLEMRVYDLEKAMKNLKGGIY